jgi:hypothetical protein
VNIPVPNALHPTQLHGTLTVPPEFGLGNLVALSSGVQLGSAPLPRNSPFQQILTVDFNLANLVVVNQRATLTLSVQQAGGGVANVSQIGVCGGGGLLPLTLSKLSITYSGTIVAPTTIATFFPPVMGTLWIYVKPDPTFAESTAVLQLTAEVSATHRLAPTHIAVVAWLGRSLPPSPTNPLDRAIAIAPTATSALLLPTTRSQMLVISGQGAALQTNERLLSSSLSSLLATRRARALSGFGSTIQPIGAQTFSQLSLSGATSFAGKQRIDLGVAQARFGGVVDSLAVDLRASYTPVEPGAKSSVAVSVAGVVLATAPLNESGVLDLSFTVPQPLINRVISPSVSVSYFPAGFSCNGITRTMDFTIDPRSTMTPTMNAAGVGGFPSLPASVTPELQVAFEHNAVAELRSAVGALCGMARLTEIGLHPHVVGFQAGATSNEPLLIVGRASTLAAHFSMPLETMTHVVSRGPHHGVFDMNAPFASMQVFRDGPHQRTVIAIASERDGPSTDHLFGWLSASPTRWPSLVGDVVVSRSSGTPVNVALVAGGPLVFTPSVSGKQWSMALGVALFTFAVALLLGLFGLRLWRRKRDEPTTPPPTGSMPDGP